MRKLASIQRVAALIPIPDADKIELAQIQGWQAVVLKGEFQVGDLGVYLEIDAVPPERPEFAFLWKGLARPPESLRIRTVRLRGCLSQGLLMPLAGFPEIVAPVEGNDVTELLGVHKYNPPPPEGMGDYGGPFPADVSKPDEQRAQSLIAILDEFRGLPYSISEKADGTSSTFTIVDETFLACGRNHAIREGDNIFWHVARRYALPTVMAAYPHLALQAEVVGPKIQKNRLGLHQTEIRAFTLFDKWTRRPQSPAELAAFCDKHAIPMAPVIEAGDSFGHTLDTLLQLAQGVYPGTKNEREGIVIRPAEPRYSPLLGGFLSFKVINNQYLLKGGD